MPTGYGRLVNSQIHVSKILGVGMFLLCPKQRLLIGPYCPIRSHCVQSCGPVVLSFVLSIASPFRY